MLIDYNDIRKGPVARLEQPVLKPELANEREGQVNQVVSVKVWSNLRSMVLYFGQGDSELGLLLPQ